MNLKSKILRYFAAMNATAFDSAVHALVLFCGVAGAHEATGAVAALNLQQLAWLFLIAFGRALLAYLDAHPLTEFLQAIGDCGNATARTAAEPSAVPAPILDGGGHQSAATPIIAEASAGAALPSRFAAAPGSGNPPSSILHPPSS